MRRLIAIAILAMGTVCAAGCSQSPPPSPSARWIDRFGGEVQGPAQQRAARTYARVLDEPLRDRARLAVLGSPVPAAYSWPDGQVFVTRGLVDLLDDHELAAAIAHEAGHLLADDHLTGVAALRGCDDGFGSEAEADARGAQLLKSAGLPPAAMASMLAKVRNARDLQPSCRSEIDRRIARLRDDVSTASAARPLSRGPRRTAPAPSGNQ